jgi:hypothetical protein
MTGNKNSQKSEVSIAQKQIEGGDMLYAVEEIEENSKVVSVESSGTRYVLYKGMLDSFNDQSFELQDSELAGMEFNKRDAKQKAQDRVRKLGESREQ